MSSRKDIFNLKLAIEADARIGHGSRALGLRVCSYVYNHPQLRFQPDEPFPLPWTLCSELLWGICDRQAYRMLRELVDRGHFAYHGIIGCPGKSHFQLIIPEKNNPASHDNFVRPKCDKKVRAKAAKNSRARPDMKRSPHISNSLREEIVRPMEEIRGGSAAQELRGKQQPAAPETERVRAAAREHFAKWKKEAK